MSQRKHHRALFAGAMIIFVSMITACSQAAAPTMTAVLPPSLTTPLPSATTLLQSTATLDPMSLLTNLPAHTRVVQSPTPRPSATPSPIPPTPEPDMRYAPADMREDSAFLFRTLEEVHPNIYATIPKAQLDQQRQALEASLTEPLPRSELFLRLAPLVTQLNDGHTYLLAPEESYGEHLVTGGLILPLRLMLADQQAWVIDHTDAATTIPLGAEVTALNDIPMPTIITAMLSLESGERQAHRLIRVQQEFDLLLWLLYHWEPPYTIRYRMAADAAETQVTVTGSSEHDRQAIAAPQQRDPYTFAILDSDIGLIDFRSFRDLERFEPFLEQTFTQIQQAGIRHLIIDLRRNGGGNSRLGDALLRYLTDKPFAQFSRYAIKVSQQIRKRDGLYADILPGTILSRTADLVPPRPNPLRFTGDVYVLTSATTFSSATSFCAAIKDVQLGTLIGEETGGVASSFGDVYQFVLPHTGLQVGVSHKYFVRPNGATDGHGVLPDHEVHTTAADIVQGRDPVLDYAIQFIKTTR